MELFTLPEEKLNDLAQKVSTTLYERHFFNQGRISGDELKKFAQHEQVNRFLIFQVFQVWEMQLNKLYHPYFDLEHEDIDHTIKTLKNQISRHISISQDDFQPMLKRAVYNNLKLLLSPKETFESFFFAQSDQIKLDVYDRYSQFFSDLDFVVNSILKYHQKNELGDVQKDTFFQKMDKVVDVFNRKSGQTFEAYRQEKFRSLTGQDMYEIINAAKAELEALEAEKRKEQEAARAQAEEEARKQEEEARRKAEEEAKKKEEETRRRAEEEARKKAEEEQKRKSFFDTLSSGGDSVFDLDDDAEDATAVTPVEPTKKEPAFTPTEDTTVEKVVEASEDPVNSPVASEESHQETPKQTPSDFLDEYFSERKKKQEQKEEAKPVEPKKEPEVSAPKPQPEPTPDPPVEPKEEKPASILDRLSEKPQTIADRFANRKPLGDKLNGNHKIKLDEIPIHKQYQYVQKVFEGNNVRFRIIVDKVNNAQNREEVEDILSKFVLNNDSLDHQDATVKEFLELLRNRF